MPAYFNKGFSVREPAWHGLAVVLKDYPGREEAMKIAGHDFKIQEKKLAVVQDGIPLEIEGWKALMKSDTGRIISVVNDTYKVLQNDAMWDIVDAIVNEPNIKYETAGVLKDGAVLWVLARLSEPAVVKKDNSEDYPYILVSTSHDMSAPCKAQSIQVRVICWNTYSAAQEESKRTGRENLGDDRNSR